MKKLKGSKTEANLLAAFAGESQARNRYTFFARKAREEGHTLIGDYFDQSARNEQEHANLWLRALGGINDTAQNLQSAIESETYERASMYPDFAKIAREEGFEEIARLFENIGWIERAHEEEFKQMLANLGKLGVAATNVKVDNWRCSACGYIHAGKIAPEKCGVCQSIGFKPYEVL